MVVPRARRPALGGTLLLLVLQLARTRALGRSPLSETLRHLAKFRLLAKRLKGLHAAARHADSRIAARWRRGPRSSRRA